MVLDWLASGQHQQDVFVLNSRPADLTDVSARGAGWYGEGNHFSLGWRKFTAIAASVRAVCRARQPDVVVCWPTGFSCWVCLGARCAGVRQLLVHAGNPPNRGPGADWITRVIMGSNALLGVRVMCCSEYVRDRFCDVPFVKKDLFAVVRNCARVAEVRRRSRQRMQRPQRPTAIMVATLERHKDHRTLLEAVQSRHHTNPRFPSIARRRRIAPHRLGRARRAPGDHTRRELSRNAPRCAGNAGSNGPFRIFDYS